MGCLCSTKVNNVPKGLGQKERTLLFCSWSPKQTTAGSSQPYFLIQWADSVRKSISVFHGSIYLKDLVWNSSILLSFSSCMVDIVLCIYSHTDISCTVQSYLLNFASGIRIQLPEDSNRPYLKYVMLWNGCWAHSLHIQWFSSRRVLRDEQILLCREGRVLKRRDNLAVKYSLPFPDRCWCTWFIAQLIISKTLLFTRLWLCVSRDENITVQWILKTLRGLFLILFVYF